MKLIVGLGNPGKKYENTKHNVGFIAIDYLFNEIKNEQELTTYTKFNSAIAEGKINGEKVILAKPLTYMNLSGDAVRPIMDWFKVDVDDLVVIYDDLDLPFNKVRFREKGSSGGHNGMKSIINHLGTDEFKRIRVGISHPSRDTVVDYVLSKFTKKENEELNDSVQYISKALIEWLNGVDFKKIMSTYNNK